MIDYIIVDPTGLIVGAASVPDSDFPLQRPPEGCTIHANVQARPFLDRLVDGVVVPIPTPEPTLGAKRGSLLARLAERRWEVETGGVAIGGMRVATDDRSKLLLVNAAAKAREDSTYTVRWKIGPGTFITLDAAALIAVEAAVFAHVQRCFAREAELSGQIDAAEELTELAAAVESFWP